MFAIRRVFGQRSLAHCEGVRREFLHLTRNNAVKAQLALSSPILSRSRPTLTVLLSRLPAASLKDSQLFSSVTNLTDDDVKRKVEDITEKYKEAMELLDDVRDSIGTVYFSEDMTDAENAIEEILSTYEDLLRQMNEDQKQSVIRTIGLKIEELKAQSEMLKDSVKDHR